MSSFESGLLTLQLTTPGMEVSVLDSTLAPMHLDVDPSSGWGSPLRLSREVPAGVYRVEGRVGLSTTSRLVIVRPGEERIEELSVAFATAAPTPDATTADEADAAIARGLVDDLGHATGDAGVVLVLRNLAPAGEGRPASDRLWTDDLALLDWETAEVTSWLSDWVPHAAADCRGRAARLAPGPYFLRTTRHGSASARDPGERHTAGILERIDQTIWLAPGWITLVFVPNTPSGPDPRGLSVHMTRLDGPWDDNDEDARAAEVALAGLRDGAMSVGSGTQRTLLYGKFHNPMLGILGLHTLLGAAKPPDPEFVSQVVRNLEGLVGEHPDVVALRAAVPDAHVGPALWPPMLERSLRACLLPADRHDPAVIPDGSLTEQIAARVRIPGPWLRWTAIEPEVTDAIDVSHVRRHPPPTTPTRHLDAWAGGASVGRPDLGAYDLEPVMPPEPAPTPEDAATGLVVRAVQEIADFHGLSPRQVARRFSVSDIAQRTGLPTSIVASSLRSIR